MLNESLYSSKSENWETPQALFDDLNNKFNFEWDLCASPDNAKCINFYSKDNDGLKQIWDKTSYMNPPYGRGIDQWVKKAYEQSNKHKNTIVCLLPVRSDTKWWHNYVMKSSIIFLLDKRLSFQKTGANNKAPFPACIVVFNGNNNYEPALKGWKV